MEIKDYIHIAVTKDEKTYRFEIPVGATFGQASDACYECIEGIINLQKEALDRQKTDRQVAEVPEVEKIEE